MSDLVNCNQAIFDAIAASVEEIRGGQCIVDVRKFIEAFNNHRDRALCTSLNVSQQPGTQPPPRNPDDWGDPSAGVAQAPRGASDEL